jgi:hypothetical protein
LFQLHLDDAADVRLIVSDEDVAKSGGWISHESD